MYNLISADLFKLRKSISIKVILLITIITSITMTVLSHMIAQGDLASSSSGIVFLFSDVNVMSILGAVLASIFICGDFDNRVIHDSIVNGYKRSTIIISKAIVFFCSTVLIVLPYAIITGIALGTGNKFSISSASLGFLYLLTHSAGTTLSSAKIFKLLAVLLTLIIVYISQLSVCVPLSLTLKKPVFVVAIYYAFSIVCGQLASIKNDTFKNIFACTPYGGKYSFLTLNTSTGYIFRTILVSVIFTIVMLIITHYAFRKTEIK